MHEFKFQNFLEFYTRKIEFSFIYKKYQIFDGKIDIVLHFL